MRILVATLVLGSATFAAADDEPTAPIVTSAPGETPATVPPVPAVIDQRADLTLGGGGEQVGRDANGALSGEALAVYRESREGYVSTFEAKAGATLRAGSAGTDGA